MKAYACPLCGQPMRKIKGPYAVVYCLPCDRTVDLWYVTPKEIEVDEAPELYDSLFVAPVKKTP